MGAERKSMLLTDEEKRVTAVRARPSYQHRASVYARDHSDPIHRRSPSFPAAWHWASRFICPTTGTTIRASISKRAWLTAYGGRVSEEIFLNQMSTGAGGRHWRERDLTLARRMVLRVTRHEPPGAHSPSARRRSRSSWAVRSRSTAISVRKRRGRLIWKCGA